MLEQNRAGKAAGQGFYEYPEQGKKQLWRGLGERFGRDSGMIPLADIKERLLFVQAIEHRQGQMVACPEEVAWRMRFIDAQHLETLAGDMGKGAYRDYLLELLAEQRR